MPSFLQSHTILIIKEAVAKDLRHHAYRQKNQHLEHIPSQEKIQVTFSVIRMKASNHFHLNLEFVTIVRVLSKWKSPFLCYLQTEMGTVFGMIPTDLMSSFMHREREEPR